jgi:HAD superfamily hydrolase (TIGR01484 family)
VTVTVKRRLIVSDLDGTLLDDEGLVSERTVAAVQAIRRAGHVFVIATGRPVRDTRPIVGALGKMAIAICGNGSISYDFESDEVVSYRPIAHTDARAALTALRGMSPRVRLGAERWLDLLLEEDFVLDPAWCGEARRVEALEAELDDRGFGKLIVQAEGTAHDYCVAVAEASPPMCGVTVSTASFCEVTRSDVDKAMALDSLATQLGLAGEDAIAFGDMPNDLSMFAWAGWSVAVSNAHPAVIAAADEVTLSNNEDGVARCLERLLDSQPSSYQKPGAHVSQVNTDSSVRPERRPHQGHQPGHAHPELHTRPRTPGRANPDRPGFHSQLR